MPTRANRQRALGTCFRRFRERAPGNDLIRRSLPLYLSPSLSHSFSLPLSLSLFLSLSLSLSLSHTQVPRAYSVPEKKESDSSRERIDRVAHSLLTLQSQTLTVKPHNNLGADAVLGPRKDIIRRGSESTVLDLSSDLENTRRILENSVGCVRPKRAKFQGFCAEADARIWP